MILTYGSRHGGAAELAKQLCEDCGIAVSYINVILMVDNWLPNFDMEEEKQLDKNEEGQLAFILDDIKKQKQMIAAVTEKDRAAHREFLNRRNQMPSDLWQHLICITEDCIGCGICEKSMSIIFHPSGRGKSGVYSRKLSDLFCLYSCLSQSGDSTDNPGEKPWGAISQCTHIITRNRSSQSSGLRYCY